MENRQKLAKKSKVISFKNFKKPQNTISALSMCAILIICSFSFLYTPNTVWELMYGLSICNVTNPLPQEKPTSGPPYIIAIDPGHGGMDTGAQSIIDELEVIEKTSETLYQLLKDDPNFTPILTREQGDDPESGERAEVVNSAGASLLISLHANCNKSATSVRGFECYPIPPGKTYHEQSMEFAKCITSGMSEAGHKLRGDTKSGIKFAYYSGKTKRIVDGSDMKIRSQNTFGILQKSNCPGVLVEQCFITNYSDVSNWGKGDGVTKAATVYYNAICAYFKTEPYVPKTES